MARPNLTSREKWLKAGFQTLVECGPVGLRVEALARKVGVSKGGFYGTFGALPAFQAAMLALWQQRAVADIITHLEEINSPKQRLAALVEAAVAPPEDAWGGPLAELAVRAWALENTDVAEAVHAVDQQRLAWLTRLFAELGLGRDEADLFYCAYLGAMALSPHDAEAIARKLNVLCDRLLGDAAPRRAPHL